MGRVGRPLIESIENNQPQRIQRLVSKSVNEQVRNAFIESFEKKEIGLTTDYLARVMKNQIERLIAKQEKCNLLEGTWLDRSLREWVMIIAKLRGAITSGGNQQMAAQFISVENREDKEYDKIINYSLKNDGYTEENSVNC